MGKILGQFRNGNQGQALSNTRPLYRIVIHKDQTVEPDVQSGGDSLEVFGFVIPVRYEGGNIRPLKQHLRVLIKRSFGDRRIVLGADRENDAALFELLCIALQG